MGTWTTVANPVAGAVITAAWGNTVKNAVNMLGSSRPRFRYSRQGSGIISNSAGTIGVTSPVTCDTIIHDNDAMLAAGIVHINTPGVWQLGLSVEWLFNAVGWRSVSINEIGSGAYLAADTVPANGGGVSTYQYCTALVSLTNTQTVHVRVAQSSGGNLALNTADWGLSISGFLVSA